MVVLPVSPAYAKEFLVSEASQSFESALTEARQAVPQARWIRLDRLESLNSDGYFWDLVHMNSYGQRIATEAFLGELGKT